MSHCYHFSQFTGKDTIARLKEDEDVTFPVNGFMELVSIRDCEDVTVVGLTVKDNAFLSPAEPLRLCGCINVTADCLCP